MNYRQKKLTRRELIKFLAIGITFPLMTGAINKAEAAKAPKTVVKYQDNPNRNEKCSNCMQFIPGKTPQANGECKIVEGRISPEGWCTAYTPKA
ncbi:MAG: high-potential iron-sulfur protein [Burkholderiales bacterium]|uniref:high-potential iron-sulfur protein n=1 Tax=Nitrosomonas sp. TaxID=42353 RepID=UPI001D52C5E8|nr:high-potential iron-sulfur protein [Nitrosomonas sp.]MCB1949341.1 high-potential iron-sulfur protein [Nitrosomonas sp.]MCP5242689.1 high-potential iron-sulfur protein [Burkholderiales bacterium]